MKATTASSAVYALNTRATQQQADTEIRRVMFAGRFELTLQIKVQTEDGEDQEVLGSAVFE